MTFAELVTLVRREIIVDAYADAYADADILDVLWRASVETAAAFDVPRLIWSVPVAAGATSIALASLPRRVHSVVINGDDLRSVDIQELLKFAPGVLRPPRYFNFDPRRAQSLMISPAPASSGTAQVEVTGALVRPGVLATAEPWAGVLPAFHSLVAYRAAVALHQMDEREEMAQYWAGEYQVRAMELAAFLGRSDLPNLMLPVESRDDKGASG